MPATELKELLKHELGDMLYEPDAQLQLAYFPTTAVVSLHYVLESGAMAESADATDLKSVGAKAPSRFESGRSHLFIGVRVAPSDPASDGSYCIAQKSQNVYSEPGSAHASENNSFDGWRRPEVQD